MVYPARLSGGGGFALGRQGGDFWCHNKPVERLLIVQTDGEIAWDAGTCDFDWPHTTALPKRLSGVFSDEPRWIDARWARTSTQTTLKDPRFRDLVAELAAPLRGIPKDELIGEDIRQAKRLALWRNAAFGMLSVLLAGAITAAVVAVRQRDRATEQERLAKARELEARQTLSKVYLVRGRQLWEADLAAEAIAHLTEALRHDPLNRLAATLLVDLLVSKNWPLPLGTSITMPILSNTAFSSDGKWVVGQEDPPSAWDSEGKLVEGKEDQTLWDSETGARSELSASAIAVLAKANPRSSKNRVVELRDEPGDAVRLYDRKTGKPIGPLIKPEGGLRDAALSPDGTRLALATLESAGAEIWDPKTGKRLVGPMKHLAPVSVLTFSPDGKRLATGSFDATARLWDATTGQPASEPMRHRTRILSIEFSANHDKILTISYDDTARVWDGRDGRMLPDTIKYASLVERTEVDQQWRNFLRRVDEYTLQITDLRSGRAAAPPIRHAGKIVDAHFSLDGGRVVVVSDDRVARVWDTQSGQAVSPALAHESLVTKASLSADAQKLLTGCEDQTVRIWEVSSGRLLVAPFRHGEGEVNAVNGEASFIVVKEQIEGVAGARIWAIANGRPSSQSLEHEDSFNSGKFSPDNKYLVTRARRGEQLHIWDGRTGEAVNKIFPRNESVSLGGVHFHPDGRRFFYVASVFRSAGGGENAIEIADLSTGASVISPMIHPESVVDAFFSPDGRTIVTICDDKLVRTWDTETGQLLRAPFRVEQEIAQAGMSPDCRWLFLASRDAVEVWPVGIIDGELPNWFLALANSIGGYTLSNGMLMQTSKNRIEMRTMLDDLPEGDKQGVAWSLAEWLLTARDTRPSFPFGASKKLGER